MPYFIYRLRTPRAPEKVPGVFTEYREARAVVREMRRALGRDGPDTGPATVRPTTIRMVFAADEAQAERILAERREPRPLGEDA